VVTSPFRITVYTGGFGRVGWIGDPLVVRATPRHNAIGTCEITLPMSHRRVTDLVANGARVVVEYDGEHLISGRVAAYRGDRSGRFVATIQDDFRLLHSVLGWPVPGSAITSQTAAAYHIVSGPAETVVKTFVQANAVTRLGLPVTVAADGARGDSIRVKMRMHPLADRLFPAVDKAGIGVTVRQVGSGLVVDCYEPTTYPRTLKASAAVVRDWTITASAPKVTRAALGADGDGTARTFRASVDTAREAAYDDVIETFVDARDLDHTDGGFTTEAGERMTDALNEGAPLRGVSLTLAETPHFRYGTAVHVGDIVPVEVSPGLVVTEVLREAVLEYTARDGLRVSPAVGDTSSGNPIRTTTSAIAALARGLRNQNARS
jgi:hypothetical protein